MSVDRRGFLRLALAGAALAVSEGLQPSFGGGNQEAHAAEPAPVIEDYKGADDPEALKEKIAELSQGQPLFVMYFSPKCGFCTELSAEFKKAKAIAKTPYKVLKIDVNAKKGGFPPELKYGALAKAAKIHGVPEVFTYVDSQQIDHFFRVFPAQTIAKFVDKTNAAIRAQKPDAVAPSPK